MHSEKLKYAVFFYSTHLLPVDTTPVNFNCFGPQIRVGDTPGSVDPTGNTVCAELETAPSSGIANLPCNGIGRYVLVRKTADTWWSINELDIETRGKRHHMFVKEMIKKKLKQSLSGILKK